MSTDNSSKINKLLKALPSGVVVLSSWLSDNGYKHELQKRYRKSNWLESVGTGAMIRKGDNVTYEEAIYALQKQANLYIHPGGSSNGAAGKGAVPGDVIGSCQPVWEELPAWFQHISR